MSVALHTTLQDFGPVLALILFGFLPNEVWRLVGLMLVHGLDEKSQIIVWVRAVATAMTKRRASRRITRAGWLAFGWSRFVFMTGGVRLVSW